ncbi:MAG: phosphatase PAP2 family protein [Gammaproteobacteria bacterium]|nr:phosphatase PAP2 family protein [Gammaproteobacteria bacterium]
MSQTRMSDFFQRADHLEMRLCMLLNNSSQRAYIRLFFRAISRLGNGVFWYTLAAFLPYLHSSQGFSEATHILITALLVLALYKLLKTKLVRERPFISFENIQQAGPALDRYSFPSGHTMHAFSFAILFSYYLPELTSLVWGFAGLVAISRVILGLHYPTDVAAGALLGTAVALLSLLVITI